MEQAEDHRHREHTDDAAPRPDPRNPRVGDQPGGRQTDAVDAEHHRPEDANGPDQTGALASVELALAAPGRGNHFGHDGIPPQVGLGWNVVPNEQAPRIPPSHPGAVHQDVRLRSLATDPCRAIRRRIRFRGPGSRAPLHPALQADGHAVDRLPQADDDKASRRQRRWKGPGAECTWENLGPASRWAKRVAPGGPAPPGQRARGRAEDSWSVRGDRAR